jgi:hypothetical protein
MPIKTDPKVYIRFFTFLSPMFISAAAVLDSALNKNIKGIIYVFGALLTMLLGNLLSSSFPNRVPGILKGTTKRDPQKLLYDPACNIFDITSTGWGTLYSSPAPHALFFAYTLVYLTSGMFINSQINWGIFGMLITITVISAYLRLTPPMSCVNPIDIMLGYVGGILCGLIWYIAIYAVENSYAPPLDLTYFNTYASDKQVCKWEKNKAFKCSKVV